MEAEKTEDFKDWLNLIDMDSIVSTDDKVLECRYFLSLSELETDKDKFRWLISAFFNAAYSFFEISALNMHHRYYDPDTDESTEDEESLNALRQYVTVTQSRTNPNYVKTSGFHHLTKELYQLRKSNTHHSPITITKSNNQIPESYQFGYIKNQGIPALSFCRELMNLIDDLSERIGI